MSEEEEKTEEGFLRSFKSHGLRFGQSADGKNYATYCPFSQKEGKLVVEKETGKWNSFTAAKGGNVYTFLEEFFNLCLEQTIVSDLVPLASSRGLPVTAFIGQVAFNKLNGTFLIPMRNSDGRIINLTTYVPGKPAKRTAGCAVSLYGLDFIKSGDRAPIYICEGEWDMFALRWLLKSLEKEGVVCSVPGASIFKEAWIPAFIGRKVVCLYDHDRAGEAGEKRAAHFIRNATKEVSFCHWPDVYPDGFDVRDFINQNVGTIFKKSKGTEALNTLLSFLKPYSRTEKEGSQPGENPLPKEREGVQVPTRAELEEVFHKWLKMIDTRPLAMMFGTSFANKIDGDPVWMFLVAPPGGMKTALLMSLNGSQFIETTSSLTPASLISGIRFQERHDPSILIKVNGKVLVVKDFTTILEGNPMERDAIFGILRDVYDGYVERFFAHIGKKVYKSKFGIMAGVTPAVDAYMSHSSSLGERFLKYRLNKGMTDVYERGVMRRAIGHLEHDKQMKAELQDVAARMLDKKLPDPLPRYTSADMDEIILLAQFTARLRGSIMRDKWTQDMTSVPVTEIGTRLSKQLMKLALGLCVYYDKDHVDDEVMSLVKEVAVDTCPQMISNIVRAIYRETYDDASKTITLDWMVQETKMSASTVGRIINDLIPLGIIQRVKGEHRVLCQYRLTKPLEGIITASKVFGEPEKIPPMRPAESETEQPAVRPGVRMVFRKRKIT